MPSSTGADRDRTPDAIVRRKVIAALREPEQVVALNKRELDLTIRLMRRARLLGRLAWRLRERGLIDALAHPVPDHLLSALVSAEARARVARWELDRLAWALEEERATPLIALKGSAYLLANTPNADGRIFADVDLMVARDRLAAVEAQLTRRGWRASELSPYDDRYYRNWAHELPPMVHPEREVEVDLHHGILMPTARLKPDSKLLLAESRPVAESRFRVLAPIDMCLHSMTHLLFGEFDGGLRELVDIDDLLRHFGVHETGFWRRFWTRAERLDLGRPAFYGLRYARRLLDTPVPDAVLEASAAAAPPKAVLALMDRLVPRALFPRHPDLPGHRSELARKMLFVRSHWIRMPAPMLARHLGYKFYARRRQQGNVTV